MKKSLLKTWLTMLCLLVGVGSAWGEDVINNSTTSSKLGSTATTTWVDAFDLTLPSGAVVNVRSMGTKSTSNSLQWNANGYLYMKSSGGKLKSVTIKGASKTVNVYASNNAYSAAPTGTALGTISVTSEGATYNFTSDYSYLALKGTASSTSITEISIEYDSAPAEAYTVNFNVGSNGACSTSSLTESSAGAGVTLPNVTPNSGYRFKGWSTSEATYTATTLTAGVFKPSADCTLYAFYDREYSAEFYVNGAQLGETQNLIEGETIVFPTNPSVDGVSFMGWATATIDGTQNDAPTMYSSGIMGTNNVEYYAVFALQEGEETTETFGWEEATTPSNWTIGGTITRTEANASYSANSGSYYGLTNSNSSVQFKNKVKVKSFSYNCVRRTTNTNTSIKIETSTNGTSWTEALSTTWNTFNSDGKTYKKIEKTWDEPIECYVRVNLVTAANRQLDDISITYGEVEYSDYCTTVSLDPKPTIEISATELAEYVGNTNTSITASVSEGAYTGALSAASSAESVAIASISEGTISIQAVAAGTATITVTAPAVTGFRKNTATIAVTVSEKLAHGLAFSADVLNLTVGDAEFSEPTLSNPNSLPVVYSLVYATPANKGKVATINSETGKITLAGLSTETQGAVTVKATTVGDNSHAEGEVTYNLVVARKVTTTAWSNGGAAVNIDQDEIATLPTASNDGERNIAYESSNTNVATIDEKTGDVAFVAYGTTTITAKTSATSDYAATSATYELTFAPRYTVTFNVNGNETELREETTGAGVTAPTVEPIAGKVFCGWAEAEIAETTDDAPAFVSTASLDGNKTLYAVFATQSGSALDYSFTISYSDLSSASYSVADGNHEATATCVTDPENTLQISYTTSNVMQYSSQLQWRKNPVGYIYNTTDLGSITSVTVNGASATLTTYYGTTNHPTNGISVGSGNGYFTINGSSSETITAQSITVVFSKGNISYSDYCTTVAIPNYEVTTVDTDFYSLYLDHAVTIPSNVTAYTGTLEDNTLTLSPVQGTIPANTGVVFKTDAAGTATFVAAADVAAIQNNDIKGVTVDTPVSSIEAGDGNVVLVLGFVDGSVCFAQPNSETLGANKAYLIAPSVATGANIRMVIAEETAIENISSEKMAVRAYNLAGQRVNPNTKGIVIVNGKKIYNK